MFTWRAASLEGKHGKSDVDSGPMSQSRHFKRDLERGFGSPWPCFEERPPTAQKHLLFWAKGDIIAIVAG